MALWNKYVGYKSYVATLQSINKLLVGVNSNAFQTLRYMLIVPKPTQNLYTNQLQNKFNFGSILISSLLQHPANLYFPRMQVLPVDGKWKLEACIRHLIWKYIESSLTRDSIYLWKIAISYLPSKSMVEIPFQLSTYGQLHIP